MTVFVITDAHWNTIKMFCNRDNAYEKLKLMNDDLNPWEMSAGLFYSLSTFSTEDEP